MNSINLSAVQDKQIIYTIRQGNEAVVTAEWMQEAAESTPTAPVFEPIDLTAFSFYSQMRTAAADAGGTITETFALSPSGSGSYYDADRAQGTLNFYLSSVLTRSMRPNQTYFLESKLIDANGKTVDSCVVQIKIEPEYARAA